MSSARSAIELLRAREERQAWIDRMTTRLPDGSCLLFASTNVPGPRKQRPGLVTLLDRAEDRIARVLPVTACFFRNPDALGPSRALLLASVPEAAKRLAVGIEEEIPGGRLLDLDVYGANASPVDRRSLGMLQRSCLVCREPARECILLHRHDPLEIQEALDVLLAAI